MSHVQLLKRQGGLGAVEENARKQVPPPPPAFFPLKEHRGPEHAQYIRAKGLFFLSLSVF